MWCVKELARNLSDESFIRKGKEGKGGGRRLREGSLRHCPTLSAEPIGRQEQDPSHLGRRACVVPEIRSIMSEFSPTADCQSSCPKLAEVPRGQTARHYHKFSTRGCRTQPHRCSDQIAPDKIRQRCPLTSTCLMPNLTRILSGKPAASLRSTHLLVEFWPYIGRFIKIWWRHSRPSWTGGNDSNIKIIRRYL